MLKKRSLSRLLLALLLAAPLGQCPAAATVTPVPALKEMSLVGTARMQVLLWKVYDAQLYAPAGTFDSQGRFALSLTYLRKLQGERIAERSVQEIRKQGFADELTLARWFELLRDIIPDVEAGDELVGLAEAQGSTHFYLNGASIGRVPEADFTERFFAIWLGERSSEPALRDRLLGVAS